MKIGFLGFFIIMVVLVVLEILCCYFAEPELGFIVYLLGACDLVLLFSFLYLRHKAK